MSLDFVDLFDLDRNEMVEEGGEMRQSLASSNFPSVYKGTLILPKPSNTNWLHHHHHQQQQQQQQQALFKASSSSSSCNYYHSYYSSSTSSSERSASALRVHSLNEKRRRERINAHLSTLRRMLPPHALKMDKASLLRTVIEQVKELSKKTTDINKSFEIPSATNEITVETTCSDEDNGVFFIKASVCCDDRPDIFADLINAFEELSVRTVRADLMSLGGRAYNVFILCKKDDDHGTVCLSSLMESIKQVLTKVVSSTTVLSGKRQRLIQSRENDL
ncbi:ACT-like protein [Dioscorea alata]|uniref:ACT-like protein n=1 Tax=Dioscorea alata TaxID=55571 RepID=A0ACB7VFP0_DIOAL|nr:ACT-like protein [Dioscorea alata]